MGDTIKVEGLMNSQFRNIFGMSSVGLFLINYSDKLSAEVNGKRWISTIGLCLLIYAFYFGFNVYVDYRDRLFKLYSSNSVDYTELNSSMKWQYAPLVISGFVLSASVVLFWIKFFRK